MRAILAALLLLPLAARAQFGGGSGGGAAVVAASSAPPSTLMSLTPSVAGVQNLQLATGPGTLTQYAACANESRTLYVRMYDSATPYAAGSSLVPTWRLTVPTGPCSTQSGSFQLPFKNGLAMTISPANSDADQTPLGANEYTFSAGLK